MWRMDYFEYYLLVLSVSMFYTRSCPRPLGKANNGVSIDNMYVSSLYGTRVLNLSFAPMNSI